jgi:hypothetical protein
MVIYFRRVNFSSSDQFSYVVSITSRAFDFIHDGDLIRFCCWVFKCDEAISISSFPVDDEFARGFQMKIIIIIIILEKCPYWRDVHIKEVYLLNFL